MKTSAITIVILLILSSCSNSDDKVSVAHLDIYYTDNLEDEARQLGSYLFDTNYGMSENEVMIRLSKTNDGFMVSFVVSENELSLERSWRLQGENISRAVFNGAPVDVNLCDSKFNSLKLLSAGS